MVVPTEGLVAYWAMNERSGATVRDSSGNGCHGSIVGKGLWARGLFGNALSLDGTGHVNVGNPAPLRQLTTAMTFSAWINLVPGRKGYAPVFGKSGFPDDFTFKIRQNNSLIVTVGKSYRYPKMRVPEGQWVHVAATIGNGIATPYINGVPDESVVRYKAPITQEFPLFIGFDRKKETPPRYFQGLLDELRIYNRVLTPEEIKVLATPPARN